MAEKGLPWGYIIPAIVVLAVVAGVIYVSISTGTSTTGTLSAINIATQTPSLTQLTAVPEFCDQPNPQLDCGGYHWHDHLDIYVGNSSYVVIPADLGHTGNTLFAIHTHDTTGIIHLECCTPHNNQTFTLGDIFAVWGYPTFNATDCLTYHGQTVTVYVGGVKQNGNFSNITLTNHLEIAVVIGAKPTSSIPTSYNFPPGY